MVELLEVAHAVAAKARAGEQIEAYAARGKDTSVRVFEGEIESLSSAESAGLGVRVVSQGRVGFAWVAALDEGAAAEALAEARDNAKFATVDEHGGLAVPDGLEPAELDLWPTSSRRRRPTPRSISLSTLSGVRELATPHPPSRAR